MRHIVHRIWKDFEQLAATSISLQNPNQRIEYELRQVYGRGGISKKRFEELRFRIASHPFEANSAWFIRQEAFYRKEPGSLMHDLNSPDYQSTMDQLYHSLGKLNELRTDLETRFAALNQQRVWIKKSMQSARQHAANSVQDIPRARLYLEEWHYLQHLLKEVTTYQREIEEDALELNHLEAQIRGALAELLKYESKEQVSLLKLQVYEDLLSQEQ